MPSWTTCSLHSTGLALQRLAVNTAAAEKAGPWLTTRATSLPPLFLRPASTPAATKPCGCVTLISGSPRKREPEERLGVPARSCAGGAKRGKPRCRGVKRCGGGERFRGVRSRGQPHRREADGLVEPEGEVHALHGRAGGALGEVVDRADGDQATGALVDGDLEVDGVRAEHRLGLRPLARGQ